MSNNGHTVSQEALLSSNSNLVLSQLKSVVCSTPQTLDVGAPKTPLQSVLSEFLVHRKITSVPQ